MGAWVPGDEGLGSDVQDVTVESRELYLADWTGVRRVAVGGMEELEGWRKGVVIEEAGVPPSFRDV